ncbi:MAG: TonB-dependent receptor plug domain-containing protein [Nitrospirota bacterium]
MKIAAGNTIALFAIVLCLLPLPAGAGQDDPPAPVLAAADEMLLFRDIPSVVGASKYEQKVTEAPSSVSIVTAAEIKKYGYRTLADILRSVRSFYVTSDRNYSYVGVRGFGRPGDYNSRVLLLIDGHRTNDNTYDQALIGTEGLLDVDLIDRVEVIRGPGSSLYGSNAFFAVVNMITKRGRDLKGAEVSGEAGSAATYKGRVTYGDRFGNGVEAIVSGSAYDRKGDSRYYREFDPANPAADPRASNGGNADHRDYDKYTSAFTKVSAGDLTLSGAAVSRTKGIPTGAFGTDFNDPGNKTRDDHAYLDLKYDRSLSSRTDLVIRASYDTYRYTGDYRYGGIVNKDLGSGDWWGTEARLIRKFADTHRLIAGAEYQGNIRQDQKNYDAGISPAYLDDQRRSRSWAAYLQDEITLSDRMALNAGVRYDHYSTFGGTTNPRVAFIANPVDRSAVKFLYGSAFRTPNDYELYYASPTSVPPLAANPDLTPEKIKTYEAVYEQYAGDAFRAALSGYYYAIRDLINQGSDAFGNSVFLNVDRVRAKGIELELDNKWPNGIEGRLSYTLQRAEDRQTGEPLTNSPAQVGKLNLVLPIVKDTAGAGIEEQYMSRRRSLNGDYAGGFSITNLTLYVQPAGSSLSMSASIYNLFDKQYGDPVSADLVQNILEQDGRSYRLKLTYAF